MNERMTKRDTDGQAMMDCQKCKADWTGKYGKPMADCTALYCRNRLMDCLAAYEDTGLTPAEVHSMYSEWNAMMSVLNSIGSYDRLRELAEADKDGRVVVLPCKVGDTVYFVNANQILEFTVVGYSVDETGISWVYSEHVDKTGNTNERTFSPDRFGKNTFLTREEAERAMEGRP